jgi:GH35 family endo-1,4-beta-xylanase
MVKRVPIAVRVTEFDLSSGKNRLYRAYTAHLAAFQADRTEELVRALMDFGDLTAFTAWGVVDTYSWHRMSRTDQWPLFFDDNYQAKPMALAFQRAVA